MTNQMLRGMVILMTITMLMLLVGCNNNNVPTDRTNETISEKAPKKVYDDNSEQPIESSNLESNLTNDYSLIINKKSITLKDWDNTVDLQKILGEPTSQNIEVLGNEADTLKGSFIKTMNYDGLQLKLMSPKENGKDFWIMEMVVTKKDYKTSKGIEIGDKLEKVKNSYPDINIALDGRMDPDNCAYVINYERVDYLQFEVKEGLVNEIKIFYLIP